VYKKEACSGLISTCHLLLSFCLCLLVLDVSLTPTGKVLKKFGENLVVSLEKNASNEATVTWIKVRDCQESNRSGSVHDRPPSQAKQLVQFLQDNRKLDKLPDFSQLTYSDAGLYVCNVSIEGIRHSLSFELTVEGMIHYTHFYYTY